MSKFCTHCGYECADDAAFCGNCGKSFPPKTAPVFTEQAEPAFAETASAAPVFENPAPTEGNYYSAPQTGGTYYAPAPAPAPKQKKNNGVLIAVIIGAAVIIAVLLGIILFGGNDVPPAAEPSYPVIDSASEAPEEDYQAPILQPVPGENDPIVSGIYYAEEMIYEDEFYDVADLGVYGDLTLNAYSETFNLYLIIEGESNSVDGSYEFYEQEDGLYSYALFVDSEYFGILIYDSDLDLYIIQVVDTDIFITFD